MWVRLLTVMNIDVQGRGKRFQPGDWVEVGKHQALRWIADGVAETTKPLSQLLPPGCGVVLSDTRDQRLYAELSKAELPISAWNTMVKLPYSRNAIVLEGVMMRSALLPVAFNLLQKWQMIIPLLSYSTLASQVGSEADRERTKDLIHDLRVPLYDSRLIFARRCKNAEAVIHQWRLERKGGGDPNLALLRALYVVKPVILAVPVSWTQEAIGVTV